MVSGPPTAAEIYGPFLLGALLSTLLYGVTVVQMFMYYRTSKEDPTWMRLFILYLLIAESLDTGFNIALVYEPLILRFGQQYPLINSPIFLRPDAIMTVLISTPVQLFMAWRISVLTASYVSSGLILILSLVSLGGGIWTTISVTLEPQFQQFDNFRAAPTTWLVASACGDVAITICLVYSLSKKKTGFTQMDDYLTRIMLATIQTGAITAVAALADAIVFVAIKNTTLNFIWDLSLSKLYSNSILSSLNARSSASRADARNRQGNALFNTSDSESISRTVHSVQVAPSIMRYQPAMELRTVRTHPKSFLPSEVEYDSAKHVQEVPVRFTREVAVL